MGKKYYVKVASGEKGDVRYSFNWAVARRCLMSICPEHIKLGSDSFPPEDIKEAVLIRTSQWFIPLYVLQLDTDRGAFQIGMNPWVPIKKLLTIPYREEKQKLKYSAFSIALRIVILGYVMWWAYGEFIG